MATVDVTRRIDDGGFSRLQLLIVVLCAILVLIDGFDLGRALLAVQFSAAAFLYVAAVPAVVACAAILLLGRRVGMSRALEET